MLLRLSPIALAIAASLLCPSQAYADGGAAGANGKSKDEKNNVITTTLARFYWAA